MIVAINESFAERYGAGGVFGCANIDFSITQASSPVTFRYNGSTHVLSIDTGGSSVPVPEPGSLLLMASAFAALAAVRRHPA